MQQQHLIISNYLYVVLIRKLSMSSSLSSGDARLLAITDENILAIF